MGRILAIDYGRKRCGVAVTDSLHISANPLPTLRAADLETFLTEYCAREGVDEIVVGYPRDMKGNDSESMRYIRPFLGRLKKILPDMKVTMYDERFTSVIAHQAMVQGLSKSRRSEKGMADRVSAVIILTDYLQSLQYRSGVLS